MSEGIFKVLKPKDTFSPLRVDSDDEAPAKWFGAEDNGANV